MLKKKYLFIFFPLALFANENNSILKSEELGKARVGFVGLCEHDYNESNNNKIKIKGCPKDDSGVFKAIKEIQKAHPYKTDDRKFIYFNAENHKKKSFYIKGKYRLDIEGDSDCGKFVRLQLQIGTGNDNCYASVLAPKGLKWHINHLYFAINAMCLKHFDKDVENICKCNPGNRETIKLDDPIFAKDKVLAQNELNNKKKKKK